MSSALSTAGPSVSILIPAFRPNWLDTAIASALAQTHTDFELLISDDSADRHIESVVAKWDDPRIRYLRNPRRGQPGANRDHLIGEARGEYLKFLFDDDFLFPRSVEFLLETVRVTGARLAFHARHFIDEHGRLLGSPSLVQAGTIATLEKPYFFEKLIGACVNVIGEPTNILLHAETLRSMDSPFHLAGRRMRFLTDVALYTNFAAQGHTMAGVGYFGSAFRQHGGQTSGTSYPGRSAAFYEWELLRRWSADAGLLSAAAFARGQAQQKALYAECAASYPEIGAFVALDGATEAGCHLSPRFMEILALADTTIEIRKLAAVPA